MKGVRAIIVSRFFVCWTFFYFWPSRVHILRRQVDKVVLYISRDPSSSIKRETKMCDRTYSSRGYIPLEGEELMSSKSMHEYERDKRYGRSERFVDADRDFFFFFLGRSLWQTPDRRSHFSQVEALIAYIRDEGHEPPFFHAFGEKFSALSTFFKWEGADQGTREKKYTLGRLTMRKPLMWHG